MRTFFRKLGTIGLLASIAFLGGTAFFAAFQHDPVGDATHALTQAAALNPPLPRLRPTLSPGNDVLGDRIANDDYHSPEDQAALTALDIGLLQAEIESRKADRLPVKPKALGGALSAADVYRAVRAPCPPLAIAGDSLTDCD
ncbi:MAG TPA: hypothetical protein VHD55_03380 [Candidatus Paceibacterota bacterium]|nr:hypothetical protein [Candidatus Paceibacterota bacterium]